ncbi:MAG: hypothetical protein K6E95_03655 [Lachnospiraceae bacterium]|nr:hypothetical protein [Lachnospiraceae bacterium]
MRIAFWSPMHGCGVTAGALAGAVALASSGRSILITQTHYCMNDLEIPLLPQGKGEEMISGKGIDRLVREFKTGQLSEKQIMDNTVPAGENLLLLPGGRNRCRELYDDKHTRNIESRILTLAHDTCGNLITELNPGYSDRTKEQIEAADILVICLRQSPRMMDELEKWGVPEGKKKTLFLIGMYDTKSRYTAGYFTRRYRFMKRKKVLRLPYLSDYLDAINGCSVPGFINEGLECSWSGIEKEFFDSVKGISKEIGECL